MGETWSERELAIAADPTKSVWQMANETGRTYQAVVDVRRHHGFSAHRSDAGRARRTDRTSTNLLCACGSQDDDHEEWCPR